MVMEQLKAVRRLKERIKNFRLMYCRMEALPESSSLLYCCRVSNIPEYEKALIRQARSAARISLKANYDEWVTPTLTALTCIIFSCDFLVEYPVGATFSYYAQASRRSSNSFTERVEDRASAAERIKAWSLATLNASSCLMQDEPARRRDSSAPAHCIGTNTRSSNESADSCGAAGKCFRDLILKIHSTVHRDVSIVKLASGSMR
ncbi:unnamed protein product [Gongylonema pulchrum]|uniref:Uncharacterized protein n=1 Tax=Gongylonema pulchrum TaxID=637853 RepID=A0A183DCY1_9BILA|nr:unnamed protein product [Gongylonema pulchrum]